MERRDGGGNPSSVAGEMISAAADPVNRAARFHAEEFNRPAQASAFAVAAHGRGRGGGHINGGGGIGRHDNVPVELFSTPAPLAANESVGRAMLSFDMRQVPDRARFHDNVFEAGLVLVGGNAREVFMEPDDQIPQQHDMIPRIHRGVRRVPVP